MKTAYKFRLYPNKQQEAMLDLTIETCRRLYNKALADRKNAYEVEGSKLILSRIGSIRIFKHREVEGKIQDLYD